MTYEASLCEISSVPVSQIEPDLERDSKFGRRKVKTKTLGHVLHLLDWRMHPRHKSATNEQKKGMLETLNASQDWTEDGRLGWYSLAGPRAKYPSWVEVVSRDDAYIRIEPSERTRIPAIPT